MARVIKADPQDVARPKRPAPKSSRQVIEKEVYNARKRSAEIEHEYNIRRDALLTEGKQVAAQAREEAQAQGAEEAYADAAGEALAAFRARAMRYEEAANDIKILALEVARKVLGTPSQLPSATVDEILKRGVNALRARRKLRVQISQDRLDALQVERPHLMRALRNEPDLLVQATSDVRDGFARVLTEVGGALCTEQRALDALAGSIDVDENARAPDPKELVPIERDEGTNIVMERPKRPASRREPSRRRTRDERDEQRDERPATGRHREQERSSFESAAERSRRMPDDADSTQRFDGEGLHTLDAPESTPRRPSTTRRADPNRTLALDVSRFRDELSDVELSEEEERSQIRKPRRESPRRQDARRPRHRDDHEGEYES